jgi:hypothetical protein
MTGDPHLSMIRPVTPHTTEGGVAGQQAQLA